MRRWIGRALGVTLGLAAVAVVDHDLLNTPSWLPGPDGRTSTKATRLTPAPESAAPTPRTVAVIGVVDGDTLTVTGGRQVRLAQVDAAEGGECFGSEATAALRRLVERKTVTLRRPPDGPVTDRYGRLLADVIVDGKSVNEQLVRDGAAGWYERYASEDRDLARRLEAAEGEAIKAGRGQWSACGRRGSRT